MIPLHDTLPSRRLPLVNWLLIFLNVAIFLFESSLGSQALNGFLLTWGLVPARLVLQPAIAWPTILTSMFLHGGWFHILSNMWILFIFGDNVEDRMGGMRYLLFYLLAGAAAALLQVYVMPSSGVPMVGASGAIAGVLGAYMILFPQARVVSLVPIFFIFTAMEIPAVIYLLFWFVSQLFSGLLALDGAAGGGIAWWAHIGGFLFGMAAVFFFARRRRLRTYWP